MIEQLHEQLRAAQRALDEPADEELARRVEPFVAAWQPSPPPRRWGEAPEVVAQPCAHCGYAPDRAQPEPALDGGHEPQATDIKLAVGWFPADEWPAAIARWPQLLEELLADHAAYSHTIESRIKRIREASAAPRLWVPVLDVDGLAAYCAEHGLDPGSGEGVRPMPPS